MEKELLKERAWIEIDLNNLEHNIREMKSLISNNTKIMAVVKANAYGHGMIEISKKLNKLDIFDFAVATLGEGIKLRKNGIIGNILILGYTSIENLKYVVKYDLIQTIIDEEYLNKILYLQDLKELKVYLKINTGMNRIGINYKNIDFLKKVYKSRKLNILGIYSHMCVSDSNKKDDIIFSHIQISRFNNLIERLKFYNIDVGKIHLQSSYGFLNYPYFKYDYVRLGIIMYGVQSSKYSYSKIKLNLKPVLKVKAKITSVKEIEKAESVSYGRTYKAPKKMKIATVSIGYADGYPRNLSNKNVKVMVQNKLFKVIGRICMDQLIVDVSNSGIKQGDIVTLIGDNEKIRAEEVAHKAGTITNELLSRLSSRLNYVFIDKKIFNRKFK